MYISNIKKYTEFILTISSEHSQNLHVLLSHHHVQSATIIFFPLAINNSQELRL